jgi:hypothetical protein
MHGVSLRLFMKSLKREEKAVVLTLLLTCFSASSVLFANSRIAYASTTPTSCGYSSDGGTWGFIQIDEVGLTIDGGAHIYTYYGSGAFVTLEGWVEVIGYYQIVTHSFSGTGSWSYGPHDYDHTTGYVTAYDGNSNTNAGTFTGYITDGWPSPRCNYQGPTK